LLNALGRLDPSALCGPLSLDVNDVSWQSADGTEILKHVTFRVAAGERVALLGPSGAGKSTLIACLAGELKQSDGCIKVSDACWNNLKSAERRQLKARIGRIYQDFRLVPTYSALDNVLMGMLGRSALVHSLFGFTRRDRKKAWELLDELGLADRAQTEARRLSGGEKQRLAIARCLMQDPGLLLADEPVASLDAHMGEQIVQRLIEINERRGIGVIGVFHDLALAERFAPRALVLCRGGLVHDGNSHQLPDTMCRLLEWKLGSAA